MSYTPTDYGLLRLEGAPVAWTKKTTIGLENEGTLWIKDERTGRISGNSEQ